MLEALVHIKLTDEAVAEADLLNGEVAPDQLELLLKRDVLAAGDARAQQRGEVGGQLRHLRHAAGHAEPLHAVERVVEKVRVELGLEHPQARFVQLALALHAALKVLAVLRRHAVEARREAAHFILPCAFDAHIVITALDAAHRAVELVDRLKETAAEPPGAHETEHQTQRAHQRGDEIDRPDDLRGIGLRLLQNERKAAFRAGADVVAALAVPVGERLAREQLRAQLLSGKSLSDGDGERSYYVGACAESGFSLILQQPQTYTAQVVRSIYLIAALMGALCLVLCLVCAWWLSRRLFEPVNELDGAMRRVEGGDYDVRIESTRQDEMGRLAASFDRMTAEYRQNLERSVQRERELNETRLRMLQSQLNPHFLYNTLDCMKWLGVTGGVPQVAELAADLAALLRAGISGSEYITLEEELELIGRYLAIQEVRFGDRFVCELDVDERFQHCVVPKLILQPLVENAIIHGVADSDEGFIKLWAEEDTEGYLLLKVSDNGSGIPPEVLERLNSHELIPGGHLGLNNVDRIVRLSYGESCGLSAYPNEGGGSCVQLRLPMQKGEDHAQGTDR